MRGKESLKESDVLKLIRKLEGQQVEFKTSFSEDNDAIRALCAFSHAQGGTVLFGVRDDGVILGVSIGKNTLEGFANQIRRNTQPPLAPTIDPVKVSGKQVVLVTIEKAKDGQVFWAFDRSYIRVGKTDQVMSPDEIKRRLLEGFVAETKQSVKPKTRVSQRDNESWDQREKRRIAIYEGNRGLFLVHMWRRSSTRGQVADIVVYLRQHGDGPLKQGKIKSVEYHLGPKFFRQTVVKTNSADNFRLEISAYGPVLCLARVNFDDGSPALDLTRYIDF